MLSLYCRVILFKLASSYITGKFVNHIIGFWCSFVLFAAGSEVLGCPQSVGDCFLSAGLVSFLLPQC